MILDGLFELIELIVSKFRKKKAEKPAFYELVECDLGDGVILQGAKILEGPYKGVIVSIHPNVKVREENNSIKLIYDYSVEYVPTDKEITKAELFHTVGDIIVDMVDKDYR